MMGGTMRRHGAKKRERLQRTVGFVGGGNMATALIRGLLAAKLYRADQLWASDVEASKLATLRRRFKIGGTDDNHSLVGGSKVNVIAVKPQIIDAVLAQ